VLRVLRRAGVIAALAVVLFGLIVLAARQRAGISHLNVVLACAVPLMTAATFAAVLALLALRSWWSAIGSSVVAALMIFTQLPGYVADSARLDGVQLRVLTGNLRFGNADPRALVEAIRTQRAGAVMLQELTPAAVAGLRAEGIDAILPYSVLSPAAGAAGVGLWSTRPLRDKHQDFRFGFRLVSAVADLAPGRSVTMFSTHMRAPWPQPPEAWSRDLYRLGQLLHSTPGPLIDGGDFNATPDNQPFRQLLADSGTRDGTDQSGSAPDPTFPADRRWIPPLIAIDHVLVRTVEAAKVHSVTLPGSDHRGLVASIGFPAS